MELNQELIISFNSNHQKGKICFSQIIYNYLSIFKELKDEVNAALANCTIYSVKPNGKVEECDLSKVVAVPLPKPDDINHRGSSAQKNSSADNNPYPYGIPVQCYNVPCIYEFRVFKYIGRHGKEN